MCLNKLEIFEPNKFGYKWFTERDGILGFYIYPLLKFADKTLPIGVWIKDVRRYRLPTDESEEKYLTGFHLYSHKNSALRVNLMQYTDHSYSIWINKLYMVEYKNFITGRGDGFGGNSRIIVARSIKLIKPIKETPL